MSVQSLNCRGKELFSPKLFVFDDGVFLWDLKGLRVCVPKKKGGKKREKNNQAELGGT